MSPAGSKILPFPTSWRRSDQTGIIQKNFPGRWLALILMGSVGAAWALNPGIEQGGKPASLLPTSKTVVEGDPQAVSQLMGSLVGEVKMSSDDSKILASSSARRVVLVSKVVAGNPLKEQREKAEFLRTVEEVEGEYMAAGRYPALPATAGKTANVAYRTDGEDFTLSSGSRRYSATEGMSYGAPPETAMQLELKGFLEPQSGGWGPWKKEGMALQPKPGVDSVEEFAFLEELAPQERGSARMFFPVERSICGYLFRRANDSSVYSSGELAYDAVSGSFSLKLFRKGDAQTQNLNPVALEAELAKRDEPVGLVGESALLADLGLISTPKKGEEIVAVSSSAPFSCSTSSALDGVRMAALDRHKEALSAGPLVAGPEDHGKASVVGKLELHDKLGQIHRLRIRGGRGVNYDWIVGQVCPEDEDVRVAGFVDSQAASYEQATPSQRQLVKAGR